MTVLEPAGHTRLDAPPPAPLGLADLMRRAFAGEDLRPMWADCMDRLAKDPDDFAALMNLSRIAQLWGKRSEGLSLQGLALIRQQHFRYPAGTGTAGGLRLLAFMVPGDFMANTPLEFLLQGSDVTLDAVYLTPGAPLPGRVPEHDLAIVAVCESEEHQPVLERLRHYLHGWPRPVLNAPDRIARVTRENAWKLLQGVPGLVIPPTARVDRAALSRIGGGEMALEPLLNSGFPIIARPYGTHAGAGLARLDRADEIPQFLSQHPANSFCVAPFVDYRGADGQYRKYRIAMVGGRPFASHMAISSEWMIHYLNAGMVESESKRAEEADFMARFEEGFAARHRSAFRAIAERIGLEYFVIDCGETRDGRLLIFETDTGMIVHSMDPPDVFPYKRPHMLKLFSAFQHLLAGRHSELLDIPRSSM